MAPVSVMNHLRRVISIIDQAMTCAWSFYSSHKHAAPGSTPGSLNARPWVQGKPRPFPTSRINGLTGFRSKNPSSRNRTRRKKQKVYLRKSDHLLNSLISLRKCSDECSSLLEQPRNGANYFYLFARVRSRVDWQTPDSKFFSSEFDAKVSPFRCSYLLDSPFDFSSAPTRTHDGTVPIQTPSGLLLSSRAQRFSTTKVRARMIKKKKNNTIQYKGRAQRWHFKIRRPLTGLLLTLSCHLSFVLLRWFNHVKTLLNNFLTYKLFAAGRINPVRQ